MAMIDEIKKALRITHTALDSEISLLISAARQDLILSGISTAKANSETDALIFRAVYSYTKGHFGYDNADADRQVEAYDRLKMHLSLSEDYT